MRIISGCAKGMRLKSPPGKSRVIRPTSDRCREALFSIIGAHLADAHVLDLYAGTGAFGIEALSRGAASALFVDANATSLSLIADNLRQFQKYIEGHHPPPYFSILKSDLRKGFDSVITSSSGERVFDIVFLDPPYGKGLSQKTLDRLGRSNFLAAGCLVIAEEQTNVSLPETPVNLKLADRRRYGDTCFWLYKKTA